MASKEFSNTLKNLRIKAGYSQKQVYEHFNIPQSTFSSWEVGKSEPSGDMLIKLCEFYKCDMMKEFSSSVNDVSFTTEEYSIIEDYRKLDTIGKSHISTVLSWEIERMNSISPSAPIIITAPMRSISFYQRLASAGTGQVVYGDIPVERISIPDIPEYSRVSYAIGVNGNSMEPLYSDGDMLLIEPTCEIKPGDIGIFIVGSEAYVKKLGNGELISLNSDYGNIPLTSDSKCMGRVVDKISPND